MHEFRLRAALGAAATLALLLAGDTSASAGPILTGGTEIAPSASFSNDTVSAFDFTAVGDNLSITALGFWDQGSNGLPSSYQVGLWKTSSQTLLASAVIDSADALDASLVVNGGSWRYESLAAPIALQNGTTYSLGFQVGPGPLASTDALILTSPSLTFDSQVAIATTTSRSIRTSGLAFPTNVSTTATAIRGNANAIITQATAVPEPASFALFGAGMLAMTGYRWQLRHRKSATAKETHLIADG